MPEKPPIISTRPRYARPPRQSTAARGYGHDHQKARAILLARFPVCQACGDAWSTDMHHKDRDTANRDPANLLAVCEACHHRDLHGGR